MRFFRASLTSITFGFVLAACGGGGSSGGMGTLNLGVTDAPVDGAASIVVAFTGVELQPAEGGRIYLDVVAEPNGDAKSIDLLALQNGLSAPLLEGIRLPAGHYNWMRLIIAPEGSYLDDKEGGRHVLRIPSGEESGLKLNNGFNVAVDATVNFTIDFDLRNSVHYNAPGGLDGDYVLRPTLRVVDNLQVGAIAGAIHPSLTNDAGVCGAGNAVYVFAGAGVVPDDVDGVGVEPITSALAHLDQDGCRYHAAFLPAGEYTVAFTANAAADDPAVDAPLAFVGAANVSVVAGQTTTHDFTPQ